MYDKLKYTYQIISTLFLFLLHDIHQQKFSSLMLREVFIIENMKIQRGRGAVPHFSFVQIRPGLNVPDN